MQRQWTPKIIGETVYRTKAPDAMSWYCPHLDTPVRWIARVASDLSASIIDGGGEATLVDDLVIHGYEHITVLDISQTAIEVVRQRLGGAASRISWFVSDVTQAKLPAGNYDIWHDRAVFHFLTRQEQRAAYVRQVVHAMKRGSCVIVATFGPQGPERCSGLEVVRYDAESLHHEFGARFELEDTAIELHQTPLGTTQQFLYCLFRFN